MINKCHLKILLVLLSVTLFSSSLYSQNRKYFVITGKIVSDSDTLEAGTIQIEKKGKQPVHSKIPENGRFRLELDYNSDYLLTFSQGSLSPKKIKVHTYVPDEILNSGSGSSHYLMEVKLAKKETNSGDPIQFDKIPELLFSEALGSFVQRQGETGNSNLQPENTASKSSYSDLTDKTKPLEYKFF